MLGDFPNPLNTAILHRRRLIQSLGYCFGNQGLFVLLKGINLLFKVEEEIKSLSPEEKKQKRQEASRPILDAFWSWVEETSALHTTNELLTKALTYATNQKEYLETFMEDGRIPISNNLCLSDEITYAHLFTKSLVNSEFPKKRCA